MEVFFKYPPVYGMVNDFKILNTSLSVLKSNVGFQGWDSQTA